MHVCLPSFAFTCYCARWQSVGNLVNLSEIASVLTQMLTLKRGQGRGRGYCSKVEPKNYAFQCKFAVLAFLPLTLDAYASQYKHSDTTLYYVSPF